LNKTKISKYIIKGVSVTGNLNRMEKFEQKFNNYVKEKTLENWKFYLFSIFLKPLFDNFINNVNTSSKENIEKTFYEWQEKHCNLTQLRPSNEFFFLLT
jgi:MAX-like protein X